MTIPTSLIDRHKATYRQDMIVKRDHCPLSQRSQSAFIITEKALALDIPSYCSISLYWPMGSELDCRFLCNTLFDRHHLIGMPVVVGKNQPLIFRAWHPDQPMIKSTLNILIPSEESPSFEPDWLFVPMLAFNRQLYRLGYGGGYYDRTLQSLRQKKKIKAIGLAFSFQEIKDLPFDLLDQPLDLIITEKEIIEAD